MKADSRASVWVVEYALRGSDAWTPNVAMVYANEREANDRMKYHNTAYPDCDRRVCRYDRGGMTDVTAHPAPRPSE